MKKSVTKRKKKTYGSPKNKGTKILAELRAVHIGEFTNARVLVNFGENMNFFIHLG